MARQTDRQTDKFILKISSEQDIDTIKNYFYSSAKKQSDPNGYVKPRPKESIERLIKQNRVALVTDRNDNLFAMCFAYQHEVTFPHSNKIEDVIEIGTVISQKGLGLGKFVVAALSSYISETEGKKIIAKVCPDNTPATHLFEYKLQWERQESGLVCRSYYRSTAGHTAMLHDRCELRNWYEFNFTSLLTAHKILKETPYSDRGTNIKINEDNNLGL